LSGCHVEVSRKKGNGKGGRRENFDLYPILREKRRRERDPPGLGRERRKRQI